MYFQEEEKRKRKEKGVEVKRGKQNIEEPKIVKQSKNQGFYLFLTLFKVFKLSF
jgi:hypothetical protein